MRLKLMLAVLAAGLLAVVSPAAARAAAPGPDAATAAVCVVAGSVCVQLSTGIDVIPQGQSRVYPGGRQMLSISNSTQINYCVAGNPSFALAPGTAVQRTQTINRVTAAPGGLCAL